MADRPWQACERDVARLLGGARYPSNSGGPVDIEAPDVVALVKHVKRCSLAELERLALEAEREGRARGKAGVVMVKRRAGSGRGTPRLEVMTEKVWNALPNSSKTQPESEIGIVASQPLRNA